MTVMTAGRPFRPHPLLTRPRRAGEATGPPPDDDEAAAARQVVDEELTTIIDRLKRLREQVREATRADDIAPLPSVYEDGEGER